MSNSNKDVIIRKLGNGSFSEVFLIKQNDKELARKDIQMKNIQKDQINIIQSELSLLEKLNNPNVVNVLKSNYDESQGIYQIYTKYFKNGDLFSLVNHQDSGQQFNENEIFSYLSDICKGLQYIHSEGIIHRDLKPSNIFVDDRNHLAIGDFGISLKSTTNSNKNSSEEATALIGSANYIAPELWSSSPPLYTPATDVFALGCILYELYTLNLAYNGGNNENIRDLILKEEYKPPLIRVPKILEVEELIIKMTDRNPLTRISINEIQQKINEWRLKQTRRQPTMKLSTLSPTNIKTNSNIIPSPSKSSSNADRGNPPLYIPPSPVMGSENRKSNDNDENSSLNIIGFYRGQTMYEGLKCFEYFGLDDVISTFIRIDFTPQLSFLMPHVDQMNPPFTQENRDEFIKDQIIRINYFNMVDLLLLRYGYLPNFCGGCDRCKETYIYSRNNKKQTLEILEHIFKSIKDTFDDKMYDNILKCCIDDQIQGDNSKMGVMNLSNNSNYNATPGDPNMPDPSFVATDTPAIAVKKNALLPLKMSYHQMDSILPPPAPPSDVSNSLLPKPKIEVQSENQNDNNNNNNQNEIKKEPKKEPKIRIKKEIKKDDDNIKKDNNVDNEMPPPSHLPSQPPPKTPVKRPSASSSTKTPSRKVKKDRSVSRTSSISSKRSVTPYVSIDIGPLPSIVMFYSGEASMNDKTIDEYIQIGNSPELLAETDFETNIAFFMPYKNQEDPPFNDECRKSFRNNEKIKENYFNMVHLLFKKYGYLTRTMLENVGSKNFEIVHSDQYDKHKGKTETKITIERIKRSIKDIYNDSKWNKLIGIILDEQEIVFSPKTSKVSSPAKKRMKEVTRKITNNNVNEESLLLSTKKDLTEDDIKEMNESELSHCKKLCIGLTIAIIIVVILIVICALVF